LLSSGRYSLPTRCCWVHNRLQLRPSHQRLLNHVRSLLLTQPNSAHIDHGIVFIAGWDTSRVICTRFG
jgi:hypothetical protein